ncbi:MAG: DUF4386 family protein [Candidatus Aenigmarchaeota archaeon]|nr:DUF4386 family protein [Candidatus Aenigmarchaeota archaeon]
MKKMNSNRKTTIIVGVLFIIATLFSSLTFILLGFLDAPDYLAKVSANETQVWIVMFLEFIWALSVVGIPVMLFPILKKYNETLTRGFFSLRFIEAITTIIGTIGLLTLLTLSQEFIQAGAPVASHYQVLGSLLIAARNWNFMIGSGLVFSLSAIILNYVLYKSKLIPRWLSGWGLIGAILCFSTFFLQFFGIYLEILFVPIAVQEMIFAVWLIFKGFNLKKK